MASPLASAGWVRWPGDWCRVWRQGAWRWPIIDDSPYVSSWAGRPQLSDQPQHAGWICPDMLLVLSTMVCPNITASNEGSQRKDFTIAEKVYIGHIHSIVHIAGWDWPIMSPLSITCPSEHLKCLSARYFSKKYFQHFKNISAGCGGPGAGRSECRARADGWRRAGNIQWRGGKTWRRGGGGEWWRRRRWSYWRFQPRGHHRDSRCAGQERWYEARWGMRPTCRALKVSINEYWKYGILIFPSLRNVRAEMQLKRVDGT